MGIVHDLKTSNDISIRDVDGPPILDDFVKPFAGHQFYAIFDLFSNFDARRVHPDSRNITASPSGYLNLTCMPMGCTNSPAESQKCISLHFSKRGSESCQYFFIDDFLIEEPATIYPDNNGDPEVLAKNPGIK